MLNSNTKKRKGPKMTLRFANAKDDRTGGEDYEDDYEKSPLPESSRIAKTD